MFRIALRAGRSCLVLLSFVFLVHFAVPVHAGTYVVDTTSDSNLTACTSAANDCSLRGAINDANAAGGTNEIIFSVNGTITLGSELPAVTTQIIITGNGIADTIVQASTCNPVTLPGGCTPATYRVLQVSSAGNVTLDNLTMRHGATSGLGGAITNIGTLTMTNISVSGNLATSHGGGINSSGKLTMTNATISGNSSGGRGGGIYDTGTLLTVTSSTFSNNSASSLGGGIAIFAGTATVTNSTFFGNSTLSRGGGIQNNGGTATVTNSTISGNSSGVGRGGGIDNTATLTLNNSIVANSIGSTDCMNDHVFHAQNSLVENGQSCSITSGVDGNLTSVDPLLGALVSNGGPTQTMLPAAGSPAIDAGDDTLAVDANSAPLTTDQRGDPRIAGGAVDMGAVEVAQSQLTLTVGAGGSGSASSDPSLIGANIDSCSNATCVASYDIEGGAPTITLTATPDFGYQFAGWTGDCSASGTSLTASVSLDASRSCGATFTALPVTEIPTLSWQALAALGLILAALGLLLASKTRSI